MKTELDRRRKYYLILDCETATLPFVKEFPDCMREKIATYLLMLSDHFQSNQFNLPFNRNELAEFLNVSRTSMCRELGRMKEEGLIDYHLNRVKLLDVDALIDCLAE